jgi:hypothetical protein
MFDALSFAEIDGQHAELLPARTVLSLFSTSGGGGETHSSSNCNGNGGNSGVLGALNILDGNSIPILSNCSSNVG